MCIRDSPCSEDEIVYTARFQLPHELRGRVWVAREGRGRPLYVDGPLLSRLLLRLIESVLESGSERVLLCVHREAGASVFSVSGSGAGLDGERRLSPSRAGARTRLELGMALVQRDVERIGGTLELSRTSLGTTCGRVRVRHVPVDRQEAA